MRYQKHFQIADDYVSHADAIISGITNPFIQSRYTGLLSISAVTVYELAIKEIIFSYCHSQHVLLGEFSKNIFSRVNGRIKTKEIEDRILSKFGGTYAKKFASTLKHYESFFLASAGVSISSSYNNIIQWRHDFAHEGTFPIYATYSEVKKSYFAGKCVVECLAIALT